MWPASRGSLLRAPEAGGYGGQPLGSWYSGEADNLNEKEPPGWHLEALLDGMGLTDPTPRVTG